MLTKTTEDDLTHWNTLPIFIIGSRGLNWIKIHLLISWLTKLDSITTNKKCNSFVIQNLTKGVHEMPMHHPWMDINTSSSLPEHINQCPAFLSTF